MLCLSVSLLHTFVPVIMMSNNNSITSCTLTVGYFLTFVLEPHRHQKWQHPAFNQSTSECHTTSCAQNGHFANRVWQLPYLTYIVYLNTSVHSVFVLDSNVQPLYSVMAMFSCSVIYNTMFVRAVVLRICIKAFRVQTPACAVTLSSCWPMSPPTSHSLKSLSAVMDTPCSSR